MANDDLNQPTTAHAFSQACEERRQLEQEIKSLLADLEKTDPGNLDDLAARVHALKVKRAPLKPS